MQSLNRVVRRGAHDQHRIEVPFVGLQRLNFGFAYGQLAMIAAGPGVGKSALALQLALEPRKSTPRAKQWPGLRQELIAMIDRP